MKQPRYWISVASKDHVLKGVEGGFCQLCHGRNNPLKRLNSGDWIIYYSPRSALNDGERGTMDFPKLAGPSFVGSVAPNKRVLFKGPASLGRFVLGVQTFTAIGQVLAGEPYRFNMEGEFVPYRRDVQFVVAQETPIRSLLNDLSFIKNKQSWGYVFRFGLLEIPEPDFQTIVAAMKAEVSTTL